MRAFAGLGFTVALFCAASPGLAQQPQQPRPAAPQRPAPAQPAPSAPAPSTSTRTEILTFDNWTVTCRDGKEPTDKRLCAAELQITQPSNNSNVVVFAWQIGFNNAGALVSVLRFPPGLLLAPGVELKLSGKEPRKLPFTTCEPNRCDAATLMDDALIREIAATEQAEATIYASDGRGLKFTIQPKGFQQALAALRK
ncbi:invasion associated locus B family protein [Terrarubrum flagellatum]|uniref:invasion associated locus B family protein n=1 Tax=Terrirubrum flagellatum TaxID=2895980 RepID=UPI0031450B19